MIEHEIFLAAVEIPDAAARRAYLDKACAGDTALRAQVEALLQAHDDAGSFLDTPAVAEGSDHPATAVLSENAPTYLSAEEQYKTQAFSEEEALDSERLPAGLLAPSSKPGSLGCLGHYEVLEVLGEGAFGTVFKAFDEKLHRMVAIKVMSAELAATSPARRRFLREARASAAIRHEHVVAIYAVEEQPTPYLVMEYVPGQTLQEAISEKGPLDVPEVLRLGQQMADGMAAAHAQGLIHRDIKPANILLETGIVSRVKLTDFGLARAADDASLTQSGVIAGTPMYMSPEQAHGQKIDQRSDLFSLGSVLYVMLSGRPPFRAESTLAVLKRVTEDIPRSIQEIIPEVPDWLCAIIAKLHAKEPDDRYQTAREVADVLAHCQSELQSTGRVVSVPTAVKRRPADRLPGRRRLGLGWVLGGATILVAISVTMGILRSHWNSPNHALPVAPANTDVATNTSAPVNSQVADDALLPVDYAAERKAAEWVLSVNGVLEMSGADGTFYTNNPTSLPAQPFFVTAVTLSGRKETEEGFAVIAGCRRINSLYLGPSSLPASALRHVAQLKSLTLLVCMYGDMTHPHDPARNVTDETAALLSGLTRLKRLDLAYSSKLTNAGLQPLQNLKSLESLNLSGSQQLTDASITSIGALTKLKELGLDGTGITTQGLERLADMLPGLERLEIRSEDGRQRSNPPLSHFPALHTVRLSGNQLATIDRQELENAPALRALEIFSLGVSDANLSKLENLPQVRELWFYVSAPDLEQGLTDAGYQFLAKLPSLEILIAEGQDHLGLPTDEGLLALSSSQSLRKLILRRSAGDYTTARLARFRKLRPDVEVTVDGEVYPAEAATPSVLPTAPVLGTWEAGPEPPWFQEFSYAVKGSAVLPGLLDRPANLTGIKRWNVDTAWSRGFINVARWSPDGKWIATAATDGHVRIYNSETFQLDRLLPGRAHQLGVMDLAWHPDSARLAVMADLGLAFRIWSREGNLLFEERNEQQVYMSAAWSSDGQTLAVGGVGVVNLYRAAGTVAKTLIKARTMGCGPGCLAWSPDHQRLACWHLDGKVRIWNVATGEAEILVEDLPRRSYSLAWGSQGWIALADGENLRLYDPDQKLAQTVPFAGGAIAWHPDGQRIFLWGEKLTVWDCTRQAEVAASPATRGGELLPTALDCSPDGQRLVMGGGLLRVQAADLGELFFETPTTFAPANDLAWSPDGERLACAGHADGGIRLWSAEGKALAALATQHDADHGCVAWSPDSQSMVVVYHRAGVWLSTRSAPLRQVLAGGGSSVAWSPDGQHIAVGTAINGKVIILDQSGDPVTEIRAAAGGVTFVAWSRTTNLLAILSNSRLYICNPMSGWALSAQRGKVVRGNVDPVWSPDGELLSIWDDGWYTSDGTRRSRTTISPALVWRADGKRYLAAYDGNNLGGLSLRSPTGTMIFQRLMNSAIFVTDWHPQGHLIATRDYQGEITVDHASDLQPYWHAVLLPDEKSATFSAAGELLDGAPEVVEKYLVYYVERDDGRIETLKPSEFQKLLPVAP